MRTSRTLPDADGRGPMQLSTAEPEAARVAARNAALAREEFDAVNRGDPDTTDQLYAEDFVDHDGVHGPYTGRAGWKQARALFRAAVPDARGTIDVLVADGDFVARRWTQRGTWLTPFRGATPTGRAVQTTGIDVLRFRGGRIVELWHSEDVSALLPAAAPPPSPPSGAA